MNQFETLENRTLMSVAATVLAGPMVKGFTTVWQDTTNGANVRQHTRTVIGPATVNGLKTTRIDTTLKMSGYTGLTSEYFDVTNASGFLVAKMDMSSTGNGTTMKGGSVFSVKKIIAPKAFEAGKTYTYKWNETRTSAVNGGAPFAQKEAVTYSIKLANEKLTSIKVPAGTFKCYTATVVQTQVGTGYTITTKGTQYFATGVGLVKKIDNLVSSYSPKTTQVEQQVLTKVTQAK